MLYRNSAHGFPVGERGTEFLTVGVLNGEMTKSDGAPRVVARDWVYVTVI